MGRPTIDDSKKRKTVSISLRQDILELADQTDNKSRFFERSVETSRGILELMDALRAGKAKRGDVLEEIEDIVDSWKAQFDEYLPYELAEPKRRRAGG